MSNVNYRWIEGRDASEEEWERIELILASRGWMSLNRPTSRILVAEDEEGNLLAFFIMQMICHTEPLFVIPSMRASGIAEELADRMLEFMTEIKARGWMLVADSQVVAKMAERRGMIKVESPVYVAK